MKSDSSAPISAGSTASQTTCSTPSSRSCAPSCKPTEQKLDVLKEGDASSPQGPSAQLDELTKYVCGLSYLNELDQEFADTTPPEVRVGEMRESLRTLLKGRAITLESQAKERAYMAQAVLWPLALLDKTRTPDGQGRAYDNRGCAGSQLDFPAQQIQGVAEVWVPFDEVIAVGWV